MRNGSDIGLIGLAVMGQNLVLNMADHNLRVKVYNRTESTTQGFLNGPAASYSNISGASTLEDLIRDLQRPRKIVMMVKAGSVVDAVIESLIPLLDPGDLVIDGGNSHFSDTRRRTESLSEKGILYMGTGISGGEEGARFGPSIMPGGDSRAWPMVEEVFTSISAKAPDGEPCCAWIGPDGAGHYVKMVHNGIEYGDMQLIAEAYHVMKQGLGLDSGTMHQIFERWNTTELESYLIEITRDIFLQKDDDGQPLLEKILDVAGQKGTGKWTGIEALNLGVPVTLIIEAVTARSISELKEERTHAATVLPSPSRRNIPLGAKEQEGFLEDVRCALLASKIVSYAQGFMQIQRASREYNWHIDCSAVARIWRGGCIIRSTFLDDIMKAFSSRPDLPILLLDPYFRAVLESCQEGWRRVVAEAVRAGIPVPALSSALSFYDGYRSETVPANLIQAQRDYFGAHTYERIDRPRGEYFHTDWTGSGGGARSGSYTA
jgi:6-phosphogluconate dehydrogenase